ncbi:hypothetical protein [Brucella pituitosa]|uniref:hypothetical protein n=1 Tax=Brucella pituitosa TaxID=571256 RepID=UPI0012603079|nr:hypothetical protein [Brucella pituitosa]
MAKNATSGSSRRANSGSQTKPKIEMTLNDLLVLSEEVIHSNQGVDDGTDLGDFSSYSKYWRQYNFYISAKNSGEYIDPNEFHSGLKEGEPFSDSTYNGYRTRAYLWAPRKNDDAHTASVTLWENAADRHADYKEAVKVSNGDPHAFCITYITTLSLRSANSAIFTPFVATFMIGSNLYNFCPNYFDPKTYKELKELSRMAERDNLTTLNKLIVFGSRFPNIPAPRKLTNNNFQLYNAHRDRPLMCLYSGLERNLTCYYDVKKNKDQKFDFNVVRRAPLSKKEDNKYDAYQADFPVKNNYSDDDYFTLLRNTTDNNDIYPQLASTYLAFMLGVKDSDPKAMMQRYTYSDGDDGIDYLAENVKFFHDLGGPEIIPYWDRNSFYMRHHCSLPPINGKTFYVKASDGEGPSFVYAEPYNSAEQDYYLWQFRDYDNG